MTTIAGSAVIGGTTYTATADLILPGPPLPSGLIGSSTELPFPVTVPAMAAYRHYFQPNDWGSGSQPRYGVGQEAELQRVYEDLGVRDVSLSFKPGYTPAKVRAFFQSCPPDLRLWVTHFHEHDMDIANGALALADYRASCYTLAELAHEGGHLFGPIHNGSTRQGGAPASDTSKPWGYWIESWRMFEAPLEVCDFWGFDTYADSYQDPYGSRLANVLTYRGEHGLPLLVGETAAPSTNAVKQATYAARMRQWCLENTALACWWQNQFSGKPPYPMTADTCRAWFAL